MTRILRPMWPAMAWTALILILLSIPGRDLPSSSLLEFDKPIHAFLFFVLTLLWLRALADESVLRALMVVAAIVIFSFASEIYQELLPFDRTADVFDAIADTVGAVLGLGVWSLLILLNRKRRK